MNATNFRRLLNRSVVLPLILTLALAGMFLWQINQLLSAARWVEHTDEVIARAYNTQKLLVDLETGVRGYLITHNPTFLEPYNVALPAINPAFDELHSLIADNSLQAARLKEIRAVSDEWQNYARDVIAVHDRGGDYGGYVSSGLGKTRMDEIRAGFTSFIKSEEALRDERSQQARKATVVAIATALVLALLLGALLAFLTRRRLITLSRNYEQTLDAERGQREHLRVTLNSIGDAVIATDATGHITFINPVAESLTGWTEPEANGKHVEEVFKIINEESRQAVESPVTKVIREGNIVGLANHTLLMTRDGREVPIDDSGAPIRGVQNEISGVVLVFRDITERKQAENERAQLLLSEQTARLVAEEASRAKDEFLATVSHELRTPLTSILGWSSMLAGNQLDEANTRTALSTIERNAKAQGKIIDDILDISRVITGKLRLEVRPLKPAAIIEAALASVRPAANAKEIQLLSLLDPNAGYVSGDPDRLQQVVWNLLNNAIKFTPKGGRVQVNLARVDSSIEVTVTDTGEGITADFLPRVFDRFQQADGTTTRRHGGLGLGLAIVRHLVELHGGTVRAESRGEHQGAAFSFRLPLLAVHNESQTVERERASESDHVETIAPLDSHALGNLKVLIVDDELDTRLLISKVLEASGAEVLAVESAAAALEALAQFQPDVLLSDIGLPDEDGYALIARVRRLPPERGGLTPAAALTAYAGAEDRTRALHAGFQIHVPKPVSTDELLAVVASLAGRAGKV
jgi:PAS domain S-box-containing protein